VQLLAAVTPAKITFKLDDKLRTALDGFMRDMDLSTSAAIRVLLTHSLQNRLPANLDAAAAMLAEARREVRAQAKAALERALAELEND
jgi:antitoxin component of RelBE/YafQ-DinJ toxin-antitoxin module